MRRSWAIGISIAAAVSLLVAACAADGSVSTSPGTPSPTTPAAASTVSAPDHVKAGDKFTMQTSSGSSFRQLLARAQGDAGAWILVAATASDPPSAFKGDTTHDALEGPVDTLTFAFDVSTAPGEYDVCVLVGVGSVDNVQDVCLNISVESP